MKIFLYLLLNVSSISIPLAYSFSEKKFCFSQYFKFAFLSILMIAFPFWIWDIIFTNLGVWGFNSEYHLPFLLLDMPLSEYLFFFCIPYACLFTHEAKQYYLPNLVFSRLLVRIISYTLVLIILYLWLTNFGKLYTTINFGLFLGLMMYTLRNHEQSLREYFPSFLLILVPFSLINGVLTGSWIDEPIVWYNNDENLNFRIFTIPIEDIFYAFNLLFSIQLIFNFMKGKK